MNYKIVIGLEVHAQLLTQSKLFSGCINRFNPDQPNSQTDPVTLALPGTLPVMNRQAFRLALKTALALECKIAPFTKWDRKQYFYPDLPKGYQISQFDIPFCSEGVLEIPETESSETKRTIRINRVHLEDDAGKNIHDDSSRGGNSKVDLNRAGTPLLEIVSEPDLTSAYQARCYLEQLRLLLTYLKVSDCNMQEGSLRCDANVNLHITTDAGETIATPIVEVKNMNSIRGVEAAIEYEAKRQWKVWEQTGLKMGDPGGDKVTRGWNAEKQTTFAQRSKEDAADYRYFPDPDLVPVRVTEEMIEEAQRSLPELPEVRLVRLQKEYKLSLYDAKVLIEQGPDIADYFEATTKICGDAKQAANWVTQDVLRELNQQKIKIDQFALNSNVLGQLLKKVVARTVTVNSARKVFAILIEQDDIAPKDVDQIIQDNEFEIVEDAGEMLTVIDAIIAKSEKVVADVREGKLQAAGPLIGQVMKEIKGADPKSVREMILKRIQES